MTTLEKTAQHGLIEHSHGAGSANGHGGSSLHRFASLDVDEHVVPRGREEAWRFTPMVRLRGLHVDVPLDGHDYEVSIDPDPAVTVEAVEADDPRRGSSGYIPIDRPSARAWAAADRVLAVTVPPEVAAERPTFVRLRGLSAEKAAAGHVVVTAQPYSRAVVILEHDGSAVTRPSSMSSSPSGATSSAPAPRSTTPRPAARPSCSGCTSPTPDSTSRTACSSTTTRRTRVATSSTRAHCRARTPTRSGWATC